MRIFFRQSWGIQNTNKDTLQTQTVLSHAIHNVIRVLSSYALLFLTAGESVEENAYVVLRLLIRRPECFGPALRGDGGNGLLAAMEEAIKISEDPSMDGPLPTHQSNRTLSVLDTRKQIM